MAERQTSGAPSFTTRRDQPLIGVLVRQGGSNVTHYFTDEEEADEALAPEGIQRALSLAGAWQDMDWAEMEADLDRIRHESQPAAKLD